MRKLFLAMLICSASTVHAQSDSVSVTRINIQLQQGGKELQKFYNMHMTGLSVAAAGTFVAATGYLGPEFKKGGREMVIGGSIIALAGIVTSIVANTHIKKAGLIFQGTSVAISIGK